MLEIQTCQLLYVQSVYPAYCLLNKWWADCSHWSILKQYAFFASHQLDRWHYVQAPFNNNWYVINNYNNMVIRLIIIELLYGALNLMLVSITLLGQRHTEWDEVCVCLCVRVLRAQSCGSGTSLLQSPSFYWQLFQRQDLMETANVEPTGDQRGLTCG